MKKLVLVAAGALTLPLLSSAALTINVDINRGSSATYSGTSVAPDTGTVWNGAAISTSESLLTLTDVSDSEGNVLTSDITLSKALGTFNVWDNDSAGNPNPTDLMKEYLYTDATTVTITDLQPGVYDLYASGAGDWDYQTGGFVIAAANGGASAAAPDMSGTTDWRDLYRTGAEGTSYQKLTGTVGVDGVFTFSTTADGYLNGFQLQAVPEPATLGLIAAFGGGLLFLRSRAML